MPKLCELLHDKASLLSAFAMKVKTLLDDAPIIKDRLSPTYNISCRVKTYESIRGKLEKYRDQGLSMSAGSRRRVPESRYAAAKGDRALRLLNDDDLTIPRLCAVVQDVVGLRYIVLFKEDAEIVCDWLTGPNGRPWFRVLPKDDGRTPNVERYKFRVLDDDDDADGDERMKPSGYTSFHVVGELTRRADPLGRFEGLRCEIQIRTLLEETWSEADHKLVYKGALGGHEVREQMTHLKSALEAVDGTLSMVRRSVRGHKAAQRFRPQIQLAQHYRFDRSGELPPLIVRQHVEAYALRHQGRDREALRKFEALEHNDRLLHLVGPAIREELVCRLWCDQALQHLLIANKDSLDTAESLYHAVLKKEPDHFWAMFRLSYVQQHRGKLELAERLARKAYAILGTDNAAKQKKAWEVRWWNCAGLRADVLCYHSSLLWRMHEVSRRPSPRGAAASFPAARKAIRMLIEAEKHMDGIPELQERVWNNLAYFNTQAGHYATAKRYLAKLEHAGFVESNPFVRDTRAWYEFRRRGGDHIKARDELVAALKQFDARSDWPAWFRHKRMTLVRHKDIVANACDGDPYTPGDELLDK